MIVYLTYNEFPSGIYSSQVVDTCEHLKQIKDERIKIISLIPLRHFLSTRKKFVSSNVPIIVLPSFPGLIYFKFNIPLLVLIFLLLRPRLIICRNAIPTYFGLKLRTFRLVKKVIFDGRAAEYEQFIEYKLIDNSKFIEQILELEKMAVLSSDFKIAVSNALVKYWNSKFSYILNNHTIIPCTLNSKHQFSTILPSINRQTLGYSDSDILLVFSGSSSQWQSFDLLFSFFERQLKSNDNLRLLLLCQTNEQIMRWMENYKQYVKLLWCKEDEVFSYLTIADYGMLLREDTITNKVASPVKFVEYLNAGLNVILSENIGDYSKFVKENDCGLIYNNELLNLKRLTKQERQHSKKLVENNFLKKCTNIQESYNKILNI